MVKRVWVHQFSKSGNGIASTDPHKKDPDKEYIHRDIVLRAVGLLALQSELIRDNRIALENGKTFKEILDAELASTPPQTPESSS